MGAYSVCEDDGFERQHVPKDWLNRITHLYRKHSFDAAWKNVPRQLGQGQGGLGLHGIDIGELYALNILDQAPPHVRWPNVRSGADLRNRLANGQRKTLEGNS